MIVVNGVAIGGGGRVVRWCWVDFQWRPTNYPLAQQSCGGDIGSVPYVCM